MHLPISLDKTLHFYRYLKTHVLVAEEQFLLLIDVPFLGQSTKAPDIPVPHGDMSARCKINKKYIGITYDQTQVILVTGEQYSTCLHTNGQFCKVEAPFQALTNPPTCTVVMYTKNSKEIEAQCSLSVFHTPPAFPPVVDTSNL